jgi:hypothetical protein
MRAFSEIYILDLHGNSKKQETCPDGSEDRNVFDIQQGVAIAVFVRGGKKSGSGIVRHADLWGVRETEDKLGGKYPWLFEHDLANTPWKEIHPQSPLYLFKPRTDDLAAEYEIGWSIPMVMLSNNMGITTGVDSFATHFAHDDLTNRVLELAGKEEDSMLREKYCLKDTSSFSLSDARKWAKSEKSSESVVPIGYRCFDSRFVIYSSSVLARSRRDICHHMIAGENQALITFRAIRKPPWVHVFVSDRIATKEYLSTRTTLTCSHCTSTPLKGKIHSKRNSAWKSQLGPQGNSGEHRTSIRNSSGTSIKSLGFRLSLKVTGI